MQVALEVRTDKPLTSPLIIVNGASLSLSQTNLTSAGSLVVKQPGHYRIATRFGDEVVPLTDDYLIDVVPDEKPSVQILRPGRGVDGGHGCAQASLIRVYMSGRRSR